MSVMTVSTTRSTASGATDVVGSHASASNVDPARIPLDMPAFISVEEAYFWSPVWQQGIREAMEARAAGHSVVFDSDDPNDAVRWLLSHDDDA